MESCHTSQLSTVSSSSGIGNLQDICRFCHCEGGTDIPLISPCYCSGSMRYVHQSCLQQWIKRSDTRCCELCKFLFIMDTKMKPFMKWEKVDMSPIERHDVIFFFSFRFFMITCVVGFLCVLIKVTTQEMPSGVQLWIKLILDMMGFIAALILMYSKVKVFRHLFWRWRAFNSIIYVQNVPERRGVIQEQQTVVFSVSAQLATSALISKETKQLSLDKNEFPNSQTNSDSTKNSTSSSTCSVNVDDGTNTSGKIANVEKISTIITLTSNTVNRPVPIGDHNHPLSEIVVSSTTTTIESVPSAGEENPLPSLS